MATKLSALTATTSAGDDDILYVGDTADGGTSYTSKKITRATCSVVLLRNHMLILKSAT